VAPQSENDKEQVRADVIARLTEFAEPEALAGPDGPAEFHGSDSTPAELGGPPARLNPPATAGEGPVRRLAALSAALSRSARQAGMQAVASGQWLSETVIDVASHLPVRDRATLQLHYRGLSGPALAEALIRNASRSSAAAGAAAGAVMSVEEWLPPSWIAVPFELLAETAVLAAIEMKLIGELHEAYGQPVVGTPLQRGYALARAWAERRGVTSAVLTEGLPAIGNSLGRGARNELVRVVRRRIWRRTGTNLISLGPLMVGGAAGAAVNRRSTRRLGEAVVRSLDGRR
jgi:uncharacterized protein (DUF697 family)